MKTLQDKLQEDFCSKAITYYTTARSGCINVSQRVGKIKISLLILNKLFKKSPKILISYPDNTIKDSWIKDMVKWGYSNNNITFTNTSSLKKYTDEKFDIVIFDECHSMSENEYNLAKEICINSKYILGLTGTLSTESVFNIKAYLGMDIIVKYSTEQAIKDGILANYQITIHQVPLDTIQLKKNSKGKLLSEKTFYDNYTWQINSLKRQNKSFMHLALHRNRLVNQSIAKINKIKELLIDQTKRTLCFVGYENNAKQLPFELISSKKGKESLEKFHNKEINTLVALSMGKTGVTYNELDRIILSAFTGNQEETAQIISRAILMDYGDKIADIHIITTDEEAELKKLKKSLELLDQNKIKYI